MKLESLRDWPKCNVTRRHSHLFFTVTVCSFFVVKVLSLGNSFLI
jgi:hypothetical protein